MRQIVIADRLSFLDNELQVPPSIPQMRNRSWRSKGMKRCFLAIAVLLGATGAAVHADYVIIRLNLAVTQDPDAEKNQTAGGGEGMPGMGGMPMGGGLGGRMGGPGRGQGGPMGPGMGGLRGGGQMGMPGQGNPGGGPQMGGMGNRGGMQMGGMGNQGGGGPQMGGMGNRGGL